MLYALEQHGALESIQEWLFLDEHLFVYIDDLYVVCSPERVRSLGWKRRCGTVEVTTHLGVARCKRFVNALIRTHVSGSVFSVLPSVTLIS